MSTQKRYTAKLNREVTLRHNNSDEGMWTEAFEVGFHVPPADMPPPRTVLDLGANIGLTAAHYKVMWPEATVYAIEMDWESFELCVQNTDALQVDGLLCQWMAVGPENGWTTYSRDDLTASSYRLDPSGRERVYCTRLNSWLEANGAIDFCKMDIEGMEWEILNEPFAIKHLLVEFHDEPRDDPKILTRGIEMLEAIGYEARHHKIHPQAVFATKV